MVCVCACVRCARELTEHQEPGTIEEAEGVGRNGEEETGGDRGGILQGGGAVRGNVEVSKGESRVWGLLLKILPRG